MADVENQGKLCKVKTAVDTLEIAYFEAVRSYNDIKQQWESDFTVLCEVCTGVILVGIKNKHGYDSYRFIRS
jgi:hypothetical protein